MIKKTKSIRELVISFVFLVLLFTLGPNKTHADECSTETNIGRFMGMVTNVLKKSERDRIEDVGRLAVDFNKNLRVLLRSRGGLPVAFDYLKRMNEAKDIEETKTLLKEIKKSVKDSDLSDPSLLLLTRQELSRAIEAYATQHPSLNPEHTSWLIVLANSEVYKTPSLSILNGDQVYVSLIKGVMDDSKNSKIIDTKEFLDELKEISTTDNKSIKNWRHAGAVWCTGVSGPLMNYVTDFSLMYQIYGPSCEFLDGRINGWGAIRLFQDNYNYERLARTLFPEQVRRIEEQGDELQKSNEVKEKERIKCLEAKSASDKALKEKKVEDAVHRLSGEAERSGSAREK